MHFYIFFLRWNHFNFWSISEWFSSLPINCWFGFYFNFFSFSFMISILVPFTHRTKKKREKTNFGYGSATCVAHWNTRPFKRTANSIQRTQNSMKQIWNVRCCREFFQTNNKSLFKFCFNWNGLRFRLPFPSLLIMSISFDMCDTDLEFVYNIVISMWKERK